MNIENQSLQISVELKTRVEILEERFDRHMTEQKTQVSKVENKVDMVLDKIGNIKDLVHENRVETLKDSNLTNKKIYTINGAITVFLILLSKFISWIGKV